MQCGPLTDGKLLAMNVPQLIHLDADPEETEQYSYSLKEGATYLGTEGDVILHGEGIEACHAEVTCVGADVSIAPVNGTTYLNGKKVTVSTPMGQGSRLAIGPLFFRLSNPHRKEWVNPPGYQYALEELQREQEISTKRDKKAARKSSSDKRSRRASAVAGAAINKSSNDSYKEPGKLLRATGSPNDSPPGPPADAADINLTASQLTVLPSDLNGRWLAHVDNSEEIDRLHRVIVQKDAAHQKQIAESTRKFQEEQRRRMELEKMVTLVETRLKEKVKQEMVLRGENLVVKADEMVKEAQHISFIMGKPVRFAVKLQTKWDEASVSALDTGPGAAASAMQSEVCVQVKDTREGGNEVMLDLPRFTELLQEMRSVYERLTDAVERDQDYVVPQSQDPWESLFDACQYVGSTRVLFEDLLHNVPIEDLTSTLMDNAGQKVGDIHLDVCPLLEDGSPLDDDPEWFIDDDEFEEKWIGQRWDALLSISQITLAPDHKYAQIYLGYHFWTETVEFKSKRVKLSPGQTHVDLQFKQQHTNHHVDQQFIEYLKSRSIQIKVYANVDNQHFAPISARDDRTQRLARGSRSSFMARRPVTAPPDDSIKLRQEKEKLEQKVQANEQTIHSLNALVTDLRGQLAAAMQETRQLQASLTERDALLSELKNKKRELNALLKSEKEKFLSRQKSMKQKITSLQQENGALERRCSASQPEGGAPGSPRRTERRRSAAQGATPRASVDSDPLGSPRRSEGPQEELLISAV